MELTAAEVWSRIVERARMDLPDLVVRSWLEKAEPLTLSDDLLVVATPNDFAAEWMERQYGEALAEASNRVCGHRLTITFRYDEDAARRNSENRALELLDGGVVEPDVETPPGGVSGQARPQAATFSTPLNERYVFDRFVVGSSNQLAAAACRAVAEAPARIYNPLFIYGGVGLGKTHLMHAVGHAVLERDPDCRVVYISSERFTNDLIQSIQRGRMAEFRQRYRNDIDLLLIDDVHFLAEKERTQEEFFHTFNALHDAKRQIVLTSDRPPKEIPGLEERLVSRFEWGLVTDIKPPDLETRMAILRKKADDDQIWIDDGVLQFIARYCRSNVRELEGAVIKLLAYSSLTRREITVDLAREALSGVLGSSAGIPDLSADGIRKLVADHWQVSVDALVSKRRTKDLTVPRQVAMYLMRELLGMSLVEIGKQFGGRDHSTVIHSIQKVESEMADDERFRARITALRSELVP